jgi:hypothetical protein
MDVLHQLDNMELNLEFSLLQVLVLQPQKVQQVTT